MRKTFILAAALMFPLAALAQTAPSAAPGAAKEMDAQALYGQKCAMCHGKDGVAKKTGEGSGNFNDPAWQKANSLEKIIEVTTAGRKKMPKFDGKLTADQIKQISSYIKTMK
jgi:cytochrome c6